MSSTGLVQDKVVVVTGGGQATDVTTEAKTGYDYLREQTGLDPADPKNWKQADQFASRLAERRTTRLVKCRPQHQLVILQCRLDQHATHAAAGTGHANVESHGCVPRPLSERWPTQGAPKGGSW